MSRCTAASAAWDLTENPHTGSAGINPALPLSLTKPRRYALIHSTIQLKAMKGRMGPGAER